MEELKFITKLLSALSPENQTELIKALKDVCKQALDVSENLGSKGIEAAKESINHTFDNIKDSVRTISDNKTKRETLEIVTNGQIRLVQLSTMKELFEIAQRDSPEQAMTLFQSQLHQPIELKKVEEQGKSARLHDVINGIKDITTELLDTIAPIRRWQKNNDANKITDTIKQAYILKSEFPEKDYPQLTQTFRLLDKCVERKDLQLLRLAVEMVKEEAEEIDKGLLEPK